MQHPSTAALARPSTSATGGSARHRLVVRRVRRRGGVRNRHRQSGHRRCAGTTRSATTSASARSRRTTTILGNPNFDDGDRNFCNGSLVTNRLDVLSEFDFVYQRKIRLSRELCRAGSDFAYSNLDNTNTATANTLVNGLPVAGALSPYTKRYSKGASGEWLDAFVFANFDAGDVPVNVKAGQHTVFWGDSLLLGGAIHSVSVRAEPARPAEGLHDARQSEAKELFRPRGGITLQAQPTKELSLAGQWFYNWQAVRIPESGSYLTINDPLNFGGDSLIFGPNPLAASIPGAPA